MAAAGRRRKPATSPEQREQEIASMAYDLAEEQILAGTASAQVQVHFLKVGSRRQQLEDQRIEHEIQMMEVKAKAIEDGIRAEELFTDAINAMRGYAPSGLLSPGPNVED